MTIRLHPGTKLLLAFFYLLMTMSAQLKYQGIFLLFGIAIVLSAKALPSHDPARTFAKLWLIAGVFLSVIHCISWNGGLVFRTSGLSAASKSFFRIGLLMASFTWLIRTIKSEELYAMLISLRFPVSAIYVLFQTIFFIPRFGERAKEILIAQQSRGFMMKGIRSRLRAYILILAPLFSTIFYELEQNAAAISAKGLHTHEVMTSLTELSFTRADKIVTALSFSVILIIFLTSR